MSKNEKDGRGPVPGAADDTGTIEVHDSGQTLEGVLEEEERTALEESGARLRLAQKNFDELKDRHLRKLAEFENMRKRADREKAEYFRSALGNFLLGAELQAAFQHGVQRGSFRRFGGIALRFPPARSALACAA